MSDLEKFGYTLAFGWACFVIWVIGEKFGLSKSDWANWVQAIGSIVAVAVAVYIPAKQRKDDLNFRRRDYWEAKLENSNRIYLLVREMKSFINEIDQETRPLEEGILMFTFDRERCDTLKDRFLSLQTSRIGVTEDILINSCIGLLNEISDEFRDRPTIAIDPGEPSENRYGMAQRSLFADMYLKVAVKHHDTATKQLDGLSGYEIHSTDFH